MKKIFKLIFDEEMAELLTYERITTDLLREVIKDFIDKKIPFLNTGNSNYLIPFINSNCKNYSLYGNCKIDTEIIIFELEFLAVEIK